MGGTHSSGIDPSTVDCLAAPSMGLATWYRLRVKDPAPRIQISTEGSSFDTQLSVYAGDSCNQRKCIVANDDVGMNYYSKIILEPERKQPRYYYIVVHGYGASFGPTACLVPAIGYPRRVQMTIHCTRS